MAVEQTNHQVGITRAAQRVMEDSGQEWDFFVGLHLAGICDEDDLRHNRDGAGRGQPVSTTHRTLKGRDVLVVTDPDRPFTAILLPEEA